MIILLSPAKKLDFAKVDCKDYTELSLWSESKELLYILKLKSQEDIKKLMKLSDNLSNLNYDRFKNFSETFTLHSSKQAIFAFQGDAYKGLDSPSLHNQDIDWLQKHLRILSGLYGVIKPLDLIQPYRLEMGTKLKNPKGNNLYDFWKGVLTKEIDKSLEGNDFVLNLASKEYSSVIDFSKLSKPVINIEFKEVRPDGNLKIISIYAKRARGMMTRFCTINRCQRIDEIIKFNMEGYSYRKELSSDSKLVFVR